MLIINRVWTFNTLIPPLRTCVAYLLTQSGTAGDQSPEREHTVWVALCPVCNFWPAGHETLTSVPTLVLVELTTRNTSVGHVTATSHTYWITEHWKQRRRWRLWLIITIVIITLQLLSAMTPAIATDFAIAWSVYLSYICTSKKPPNKIRGHLT